MHPIFMDLSHWEPFGISMSNPLARIVTIIILVGGALLIGNIWDRRVKKFTNSDGNSSKPWFTDIVRLALVGLGGVLVLGFIWVVGQVFSYGLMVAMGFIFAGMYARRRFVRAGMDVAILNSLVMISLICGIIGARITYIFYNLQSFTNPYSEGVYRTVGQRVVELFKISQGGLVFDGGVTLAVIVIFIYIWAKKLPGKKILDIMSVALMIGLSFGRVGCFLNGCCYGERCSSHWALGVHYPYSGTPVIYPQSGDDELKNPWTERSTPSMVYSQHFTREKELEVPNELIQPMPDGSARLKMPSELHTEHEIEAGCSAHSLSVHPAQLYAVVNAALIAALLGMILRSKHTDGQVFTLMLVFYGLTRFILELIRDDNPDMAITTAQIKCLAMMAAGAIAFIIFSRRKNAEICDQKP